MERGPKYNQTISLDHTDLKDQIENKSLVKFWKKWIFHKPAFLCNRLNLIGQILCLQKKDTNIMRYKSDNITISHKEWSYFQNFLDGIKVPYISRRHLKKFKNNLFNSKYAVCVLSLAENSWIGSEKKSTLFLVK